jgi:hypothetical protein
MTSRSKGEIELALPIAKPPDVATGFAVPNRLDNMLDTPLDGALYTVPLAAAVASCCAPPLYDATRPLGVGDVKLLTGTPDVSLVISVETGAYVGVGVGNHDDVTEVVIPPMPEPSPLLRRLRFIFIISLF